MGKASVFNGFRAGAFGASSSETSGVTHDPACGWNGPDGSRAFRGIGDTVAALSTARGNNGARRLVCFKDNIMMKKIVLAALASATMLAGAGSAQASTTTAASGLTFKVGAACTITASVADLGTYNVGDTFAAYAKRQGEFASSGYVYGTDSAVKLASVTCPNGVAWKLSIVGSLSNGFIEVKNPTGAVVANVAPFATTADGANVNTTIEGTNSWNFATGTGKGSAQDVLGFYSFRDDLGTRNTTQLVTGTYTGAATATLTY